MIIREFLCLKKTGTLIFHRKYQKSTDTNIMLQSGLITALYTFAKQVVKDEMEHLQMKKVSMLFNHQNDYIFVLFLDSNVNLSFCESDFKLLQQMFFDMYPETLWNKEIINTSLFNEFKDQADEILLSLEKKLQLFSLLINEDFIKEKELDQTDLEDLGRVTARRILERHHNYLLEAKLHNPETLMHELDNFLELLGLRQIERDYKTYYLRCDECQLCRKNQTCFYEGFLHTIADHLDLSILCSQTVSETKKTKDVTI